MIYRILFLFFVALTLLAVVEPKEHEWNLKKEEDRMWIYTRDREGSDIKEVRLVMDVNATIDEINSVLDDAERQTEWVYRCKEAKDLGGRPDTGWYYYSRISMPWPLEDRDVIAKVTGSKKNGIYSSTSVAAPNRAPLVEDCVRLTDFDVRTQYKTMSDGSTQMTYDLHSEPGGYVPSWLVNMFIDKGPVATMTKLRTLVEK